MIWSLLLLHAAVIALGAAAGRRLGIKTGLGVAAIPPLITAIWATRQLISEIEPQPAEHIWVQGLNLVIRFRADSAALMMAILVSGIGALVFVYAIGYFNHDAIGPARFPAALLAFSASMLGLVLADSAWTLFIFWELTSITSFVLVAYKTTDANALKAARQALMITAGGGLALLAGLLLLERAGGASNFSDLGPVTGPGATVAAVLLLIAAATKSAQTPFHMWLPGAMAAPTPVSAYLHSATMVKAGVLLIATLGAAFTTSTTWEVLGLSFGIVSMLWGAYGALRHVDAKLILAWGTISQLGLLVTLLSLGTGKAVFAATSMLFAHALFKAALFAVVGEIDVRTGTRDITILSGLARLMPTTTAIAVAAGLSMAGVPPLLGFAAKEAAIEAVLELDSTRRLIVGGAVIGGAVLTVAYTLRLLLGLFGPSSGTATLGVAGSDTTGIQPKPARLAMTLPAAVLAALGLLGFVLLDIVNKVVTPAAVDFNPDAGAYKLLAWPGLTTGLMVSLFVVIAGALLGTMLHVRMRATTGAPRALGADFVDRLLDTTLSRSGRAIGYIQHGSLPLYLAAVLATVILVGTPFIGGLNFDHLKAWDRPLQMLLAVAIVIAAFAGARVRSRLGAALTLGAVGICVSGIFVLHGAPDLVLTQLLVETIIVVGFVVGLGHLARRFPKASDSWLAVRVTLSVLTGAAVVVGLIAAGASPTGTAPIDELAREAVDEGGGKNIVNVILTDIRALDTLGEVVVLAVVAVGLLALANVRRIEVNS